jgi:TolB-like protein
MTAYATCGERAASLNAYERCAIALAEAADITPSPQTQALLAQIRGGTIETADHSSSPASPAYRPADRARYRGGRVGARLGVMPFRSLGSTQEDPLSLGLAEEITAALSRFRWFYLIASPSLANLAGEAQTTGERWRALDLDFLLDGTVQRGQDRVRVRARLLDLHAGGEVIWTNSFDRRGEDLLTLQDEIAAETVARIDPALMQREGSRAASGPPSSSTAYDLVLRSIPALYRLQEHSFRAAGETLGEAVALAPDYAAAHAWFACWHIFLVGQNWAHNPAAAMARAGDLADRAVMLDPSDARALTLSGHVHAFLHERVDEAIDLHDRALALNPNLPMAWAFSGLAHSYAGMHEDALLRIENALRLSPFDPHAFFFEMAKMLPNLVSGSFERVVQLGKHSIALNPSCTSTYKLLLSACGHLGREAECRALGQRLLQLEPGFRVSAAVRRSCLQRPSDRDVYAQGLRRAGLPE